MLPEIVHQEDIAELYNLSPRQVQNIGDDNKLIRPKAAHYNLREWVRARDAEREKKSTPAIERSNLAKAKREERKDKIESGEIIEANTVIKAWENVTVTWRQRMLKVGNNVQSKVGLNEQQRKAVDDEVSEGLKELDKKLNYAADIADEDEEKAVEALKPNES